MVVISSKTNPLNGKYAELADGMNAYFDMVNADGGIYGRQLKISKERDDVIGLQNTEQVQASLAEDNAFATFIATLQLTGADALEAAGQPTFIWNINPEMPGHDNIFANSPAICFGCAGQIVPYVAQQLKATKVGVLALRHREPVEAVRAGHQGLASRSTRRPRSCSTTTRSATPSPTSAPRSRR